RALPIAQKTMNKGDFDIVSLPCGGHRAARVNTSSQGMAGAMMPSIGLHRASDRARRSTNLKQSQGETREGHKFRPWRNGQGTCCGEPSTDLRYGGTAPAARLNSPRMDPAVRPGRRGVGSSCRIRAAHGRCTCEKATGKATVARRA